jgi:hypothetical protein
LGVLVSGFLRPSAPASPGAADERRHPIPAPATSGGPVDAGHPDDMAEHARPRIPDTGGGDERSAASREQHAKTWKQPPGGAGRTPANGGTAPPGPANKRPDRDRPPARSKATPAREEAPPRYARQTPAGDDPPRRKTRTEPPAREAPPPGPATKQPPPGDDPPPGRPQPDRRERSPEEADHGPAPRGDAPEGANDARGADGGPPGQAKKDPHVEDAPTPG